MTARVLLGIVAALRAVLIPGQAALMLEQPLTWPRLNLVRRAAAAPGDRRNLAVKARAA